MTANVIPLLGEDVDISAGDLRAVVVPAGAALRGLYRGERALIDGFDRDEVPSGAHGQVLVPWPNRVADGRYTFRGAERQLSISEPDRNTALHGLTRWEGWVVAEYAGDRVLLRHRLYGRPGYPHVLDLAVSYRLDADTGLTVQMTATNVGSSPAPYGHGTHPYLTAGAPRIDACLLQVPAARWLPTDSRGIPHGTAEVAGTRYDFRTPRQVGDLEVDYAYTDLERDGEGRAWVTLGAPEGTDTRAAEPAQVSLWVDETFRWVEIFTGDTLPEHKRRTGLGVEPMSCPPNAFVTGEGVTVLEPGQSTAGTWGITG